MASYIRFQAAVAASLDPAGRDPAAVPGSMRIKIDPLETALPLQTGAVPSQV